MNKNIIIAAIATTLLSTGVNIPAVTYTVGPGKMFAKLQDVADKLGPGDNVLVDGNTTYPANIYLTQSGTVASRITISGLQPSGASRPKITGTGSYGINVTADNIVLEGFEVIGGPKGIGVFGDNITVRNCVLHGCNQGLIGYGTGTGSVTVEYCEFYGNGVPTGGATQHQIYMATDEIAHPKATFRLQYCYLHDGVEGDNVKSRCERSEIYYNWIELAGSSGHGLGLFAPDPDDNDQVTIATAREDADVVGNVIIQSRNSCARIGGDLPGYPTNGRYRFVNNTFVLTGARGDVIRTFNTIETLEMYNNVMYATTSGSDTRIINDADGAWLHSPRCLTGGNNWVVTGATMAPTTAEWSATVRGSTSPFVNASSKNFHPLQGGPLENGGAAATPTIAVYPFSKPLFPPAFQPPQAALIDTGTSEKRPSDAVIDIGAFEGPGSSIIASRFQFDPRLPRDRHNAGCAMVKVYGADGKIARELLSGGAGFRIVRSQDRSKTASSRITFK